MIAIDHGTPLVCTGLDLRSLVDHLEDTHHRYLWDVLPRLTEFVDEALVDDAGRHEELAQVGRLYASIRVQFESHLRKEERLLFPMVRDLAASDVRPSFHCGSLRNPISVMIHEHDVVDELLAQISAITNGFSAPPDACAAHRALVAGLAELDADTRTHVHTENSILFPEVVRLEHEHLAVTASHLSG